MPTVALSKNRRKVSGGQGGAVSEREQLGGVRGCQHGKTLVSLAPKSPLLWAADHGTSTHGLPSTSPLPPRPLPLRTTEPGLQSSRVTRWRCWRSRRSAGCAGSRRWPSKVMKMGLRVSSSSRHRPSLRGRHSQGGRSWGPPSPARDPPEAVTAPGPAEEGVGQHHDEAPAAAQVH